MATYCQQLGGRWRGSDLGCQLLFTCSSRSEGDHSLHSNQNAMWVKRWRHLFLPSGISGYRSEVPNVSFSYPTIRNLVAGQPEVWVVLLGSMVSRSCTYRAPRTSAK